MYVFDIPATPLFQSIIRWRCFPVCVTLITLFQSLERASSYCFLLSCMRERLGVLMTWTCWEKGNYGADVVVPLLPQASDGSSLASCPCKQWCITGLEGETNWWKDSLNRIWCPVWHVVYIYIYITSTPPLLVAVSQLHKMQAVPCTISLQFVSHQRVPD